MSEQKPSMTLSKAAREEILKESKKGYDFLVMANPFTRGLENHERRAGQDRP
jgi:hypothetical protein